MGGVNETTPAQSMTALQAADRIEAIVRHCDLLPSEIEAVTVLRDHARATATLTQVRAPSVSRAAPRETSRVLTTSTTVALTATGLLGVCLFMAPVAVRHYAPNCMPAWLFIPVVLLGALLIVGMMGTVTLAAIHDMGIEN